MIQVVEMRLLRNTMRNSITQSGETLSGVTKKECQVRWFRRLTRMPPDASEVSVLGMFPRVDLAHTGEIISFSWLGNTLMSLWQNWRWWLGLLGLLPLQPGPKYVAKK